MAFPRTMVAGLMLACVTAAAQKPQADDAAQKASAAFRAGIAAQQAGQLEAARAQFARAVQLQPNIAEGHEALGAVLLELGNAAAAVPVLETAERLKPDDPGIESDLALACAQAQLPAKAIPHFEQAEKLSAQPFDAAFYDAYARALAATGKRDEAIAQFQAEEKLTGPRAETEDAIGTLQAQAGRWDEARTAFDGALQVDSYYMPARLHLAAVLIQQHNLPGALDVLQPAVDADPPSAPALATYGHALALAGQDEAAAPVLQKALRLDPALPDATVDLAMVLQRLGKQQEAIPWFEKALQTQPNNANILSNLALAMTLTGKAKDALPYFDRAVALDPGSATILKDRGVAHIQLSAFDEAIVDFQAALKLNPGDPQLHYDLGLAYKFKDRMEDAAAELAKAGQMDPTLQDPPYTLGILYMQMGKMDEAAAELRKAVALRPQNGSAWAILGSTLKQAGHLEEARQALEKAIPLQPGQPGPLVTLAGVLAEQAANLSAQAQAAESAGDTARAEQLRAQMKDLRAKVAEYRRESAALSQAAVNRQRATFLLNAGNQLLLKGQIADAIARYQESIAADATFAEPHAQLALAYEQQGRAQEATAERARAAELSAGK